MDYSVNNPEVLYTTQDLTRLDRADVETLKSLAAANPRQRVRLCSHPRVEDTLHEMIIVHTRGAYVRPHKHPGKSESFHLIEGRLQVIVLEEDGAIRDLINMGPAESGATFYHRLSAPWYHTLMPLTEMVVFHETTNGPFLRDETVFAPWSPEEDDTDGCQAYLHDLAERISDHQLSPA